jgi:hypothetical protein
MTQCTVCNTDDECRPYGRGGTMICFDCAMKDEAETSRNFLAQLDAAHKQSNIVLLGEESGPRPVGGNLQ